MDKILRAARDSYGNFDYAEAIRLARKALGQPGDGRAWRIIGSAACNLLDLKLAAEAYQQADSTSKQFLTVVCLRAGISFKNGQAVPTN